MNLVIRSACLAFAAAVALHAQKASAEEIPPAKPGAGAGAREAEATPVTATPPEPATTSEWYGWQVLIADVSSVAVGLGGAVMTQNAAPAIVGSVGFLTAGPIIHAAHGRNGAALGSLGLRVGLGVAGGLVGGAIGFFIGSKSTYPVITAFLYGAAVGGMGLVTASVLDIALLSRVTVKSEVANHTVRWRPLATATFQGAQVGVAGTF